MNQHVTSFIREIHPVDLRSHGGLQAVRLGRATQARFPALRLALVPLTVALSSGAATVVEVDDGDVGRLQVTNRGGALLFGMAGELVVGGRQDRVLNSSVLIAPGASVPVHVSCIERNRWESAGARRSFQAARATATPTVRSAVHGTVVTSLRQTGVHQADQGKVWTQVSGTLHRTGTHGAVPTGTLVGGLHHHRERIDAYARACAEVDPALPQLGLALFTPGTPGAGLHGFASIDCFCAPELLGHYASRLVRGAALEARDSAPVPIVSATEATRQLLAVLADQRSTFTSPAAGEAPDAFELHYSLDGVVASVLCYQEQPIHLAISPVEQPEPFGCDGGPGCGAGSASPGSPSDGNRNHHGDAGTRSGLGRTIFRSHHIPADPPAHCGSSPGWSTAVSRTTARAMLQLLLPDGPGRFIQLQSGAFLIGRSSECDIQLADETISRIHARVDVGIDRAAIVDLDSTNGVCVNGEPVLLAQLHPGDSIALGFNVHLRFLRPSE